jgi:hypothetical protein
VAGSRKLSLRVERLAEITTDELALVAGGALTGTLTGTETYRCPTYPVNNCLASQNQYVCVNTLRCTPYITPPTI